MEKAKKVWEGQIGRGKGNTTKGVGVCSLKECKTGFWKERSCGHRNSNFNVLIGNFVKKSTDV